MTQVITFIKSIFNELCILFVYVFLINNYIGKVDQTIRSDGQGYYDYLPSIFIHHDFVRKDITAEKDSLSFLRVNSLSMYIDYKTHKVNKYSCGTAVLQLPFFIYAYISTPKQANYNDGYQLSYQKAVFHAALFYLFLSVFFLKKLLNLYQIKPWIIVVSQVLLVLATNVTHYSNMEASFSHVYSLFAVTTFFYFTKSYFLHTKSIHLWLACIFLGMILIIRPINIICISFIPFLAGSYSTLKNGIAYIFKHPLKLLICLFLITVIFSIQCMCWYLQTGYVVLYSYQGEGFNFLQPQFFNILVSYKKGLFVYTPVLLICMSGLLWMIFEKKYYLFFAWMFFFITITYVLSSWWCWYYGASYGLRAYIDFYAAFFTCFTLMLTEIRQKLLIVTLSLFTIPFNIIQTYQYKEFIMHWTDMTKEKYWKVFLKTDKKYGGLLWKNTLNDYTIIKEIKVEDLITLKNTTQDVCNINSNEINGFEKVTSIQILIDNEFREDNNTEFFMCIDKPKESTPHHTHLIQFAGNNFNVMQTGSFSFDINMNSAAGKIILFKITNYEETTTLKNIRVRFVSKN